VINAAASAMQRLSAEVLPGKVDGLLVASLPRQACKLLYDHPALGRISQGATGRPSPRPSPALLENGE
jgi:hypothetical protein